MPTGTITRTKVVGQAKNSNYEQWNMDDVTLPANCTWAKFRFETTNATYASQLLRNKTNSGNLNWFTDYTDVAGLLLFGNTPRFYTKNNSGAYVEHTVTLTLTYNIPYTPVETNNKIVVADINQTGTSITSGTKIQASIKSGLTAGNKITANDFNRIVLGLN